MSLSECREKLDLRQGNFWSQPGTSPRFGDPGHPLAGYRDAVSVFVEVDEAEATRENWKAGFYLLDIKPEEVYRRFIR
jgi:hypothetical protein